MAMAARVSGAKKERNKQTKKNALDGRVVLEPQGDHESIENR